MNKVTGNDKSASRDESPFHAGEQAVQKRLGVRDAAEQLGRAMIRPFMPDQHREFFHNLVYLFVGISDEEGLPWATILTGQPGFISSPNNRRLQIRVLSSYQTLAIKQLKPGRAVGLLGIDLAKRRRNRLNGVVAAVTTKGAVVEIDIAVHESFGNCPQYIQAREVSPRQQPEDFNPGEVLIDNVFNAPVKTLMTRADTFFIATQHRHDDGLNRGSADISHRGGEPGFVHVENDKTAVFPDYRGNRHFNTLGNLSLDSGAGLLFIDFTNGDALQLRGASKILWDDPRQSDFPGAERLIEFTLQESCWMPGSIALRWHKIDKKPRH
ncbi:MAG: pyridoxamine 5'-phosphate oxidase family protein [Gammaproteobacteria bacterium]|nr:pyridoxamine 5'-phosphate oxidase family protein [Gammaproteobacteria bacterium]MBQ0840704.1 pyridoxamine 5'-phosphate oxidase family protein [Gammaproteobacteria bacterium]